MPRPLLTGCAATAIAASVLALAGLATSGSAASAATRQPGGGPPVSLAITSVTPTYATPGHTVTVSGTLTNTSRASLSGLSVQLRSSSTAFDSRNALQEYADGTFPADEPVPGAVTTVTQTLAPRATADWSVTLPASQVPITEFGVYPLAAEAENASQASLTVDRTFLPFWPGTKAADPRAEDIAWVWPLIDQPRQGVCSGLLNNGLAASVATGGRLSGLLQAGATYSASAHLTWAIDPALLANLTTMTKPYTVGSGGCDTTTQRASSAASSWLTGLKSATAGQPVFLTPYADADIAALTRSGMNSDLTQAFTEGRTVASNILGRNFTAATGAATATSTNLTGMAWPADGIANYAVLENLAANDKINTVVLDSTTMPASPQRDYTPSAQTTTPDGVGAPLKVLLSDDTITQILGSANSPSDSKATAFSVEQRFLAETAMIAAEQPSLARSVVVAPPRRWDPPAALASDLLAETVSAPWLRPVSLGQLAAAKHPSGQVSRRPPRAHSRAELSKSLLSQAHQLDQQVRLLMSVEQNADPALEYAAAAVESSAWRGGGSAGQQGAALAQQISAYLSSKEHGLTISAVTRVTLGGLKGTVLVSVGNALPYAVKVELQADPGGGITVVGPPHVLTVPAGQQQIVKVTVAATAVGSSTLRLQLVAPDGTAFPAQKSMTVQVTHYGTLVLVIIGAALGIFVLTAATRAIRRARRKREPEDGAEPADQPGWPDKPDEADNVIADGGEAGGRASAHDPAEETDDYAWAPGRSDRR
jgi:uncharacterized protein DUF6049